MRVRVTACVCVCLMRLLLAKTFNIVSFEKKRIKKKVCVQFVAITREERKRKEREREMETLVFLEFCVVWFCSSSSKKRDKTTSERINIII